MEVVTILPVEDFIAELDKKNIAKVLKTIRLLADFGYNLSMPQSKRVAERLFELRIRGEKEIRIFYTFHNEKAYLIHGFVKKSEKTPQKEIQLALYRKRLSTGV